MPTMTVTLNGTSENRWHRLGLKCNPFPQLARAETLRGELAINQLDGDPLTGPADIRARLAGFSEEFIELCIAQFRPGQRVRFRVTFPER